MSTIFEFVHHLLPDLIHVGQPCALAQCRFGKIKPLAHGGRGLLTGRELAQLGDPELDDEPAAGDEMAGGVAEAFAPGCAW